MKMKKSLLIVPAMATMLLAAAGSVGGTVAWFSANTAFDTSITSFKVVRLNGDLDCTLAEGYGTDLDETGQKPVIKVENYAELTHGSFDHGSGRVYTSNRSGVYTHKGTIAASGGSTTSATDLQAGSYTENNNKHIVWNAVTWHMTFTYQLGVSASTAPKTNLYFDLDESEIIDVLAYKNDSNAKKTSKGFRIAFYPDTNTTNTTTDNVASLQPHVWAGAYTDTAGTYKYVKYTENGEPEAASTLYSGNVLLDETTATKTAAAKSDAADGSTSANNCLGQFIGFTNGTSKITFTCVAWFEGEDINVVNEAAMESLSVNLSFFTLSDNAPVTP